LMRIRVIADLDVELPVKRRACGHEQIEDTFMVILTPIAATGGVDQRRDRSSRDALEGSIAVVVIEQAVLSRRRVAIPDKEVQPAVVVIITPSGGDGKGSESGDLTRRHSSELAVAIIVVKLIYFRTFHITGPLSDKNISD